MTEFPETQSALLAQIRSPDDREAWERFVLIYRPVIYRMARRRGLQDADALDVVQTVLMRINGAIGRWERQPGAKFRHWLRRIAANAICNALSRSPRDRAMGGSEALAALAEHAEISPDFERELALEAMRERYLRAAATVQYDVNPETWRAFELSVIHGMSCEEAAADIDRSIGSVYAARSRVMRRLRDEIQRLERDET